MDLLDEDVVQTQTLDLSDSRKLDQILEDKYKELFGEEYLTEDRTILNNPSSSIKLNACKIIPEEQSIAFRMAMAEYKRDQEASITKYNFESSVQFPTTMQCMLEEEQTKPQEDEEEVIEIHITEEEQKVITKHVEKIAAVLLPIVDKGLGVPTQETPMSMSSNRKMKRANWAHQQRQMRKIRREFRDQNPSQNQ